MRFYDAVLRRKEEFERVRRGKKPPLLSQTGELRRESSRPEPDPREPDSKIIKMEEWSFNL